MKENRGPFYFILFLVTFLFDACQNQDFQDGTVVNDVNSKVEVLSDQSLRCPEALIWFDNHLAIVHQCGSERLQIINLNDNSEQWLASVGDGPEEVLSLNYLPSFLVSQDPDIKLRFYDSRNRRILNLVEGDGGLRLEKSSLLPNQISGYLDIFELQDGSFVYNQSNGLYNLGRFYPDSSELFVEDFYPGIGSTNVGIQRAYDYYNSLLVHPEGKSIVQALQGAPFLVAYNEKLELITYVRTDDSFKGLDPTIYGPGMLSPRQYVLEAHGNHDYIYVLNPQTTFDETSDGNFFPRIEIYDWELNPLATLNLDRLFVYMTIDYENQKIYGVTLGEDELSLGVVTIPSESKNFFTKKHE